MDDQILRAAKLLASYDMYPNWDMMEDGEQLYYLDVARRVARELKLEGGEEYEVREVGD